MSSGFGKRHIFRTDSSLSRLMLLVEGFPYEEIYRGMSQWSDTPAEDDENAVITLLEAARDIWKPLEDTRTGLDVPTETPK
jgi:hypothetical protein